MNIHKNTNENNLLILLKIVLQTVEYKRKQDPMKNIFKSPFIDLIKDLIGLLVLLVFPLLYRISQNEEIISFGAQAHSFKAVLVVNFTPFSLPVSSKSIKHLAIYSHYVVGKQSEKLQIFHYRIFLPGILHDTPIII